jgi:hypothetical protein
MEGIDPADLERLIVEVFTALRRCRALDSFRFWGKLVCAVDATTIHTFKEKHCDQCTHQTSSSGVTTYFHNVLAAKIVTSCGLLVPLAFQFIENPDGPYEKQDCELKAWRRLFDKIQRLYPRLKLIFTFDGLYADETTMVTLERAGMDFVICLSDDKLPSVTKQLPAEGKEWRGKISAKTKHSGRFLLRTARWQPPVTYHGELYHVFELEETHQQEKTYFNRWISNLKPDSSNALDLAQIGRLRWKIENEGTNTQKNGGFEMTHGFGLGGNAWKNYYLMLQVSQLLNDLVRLTDILQKATADPRSIFRILYESMRNYATRLVESLRTADINLDLFAGQKIQLRFIT